MGKISTAEVLRLHAPSAVSRDRSVTRSAQDDGLVRVLTKNIPNKLALWDYALGYFQTSLRDSTDPEEPVHHGAVENLKIVTLW
jgi:hypothetical protein